MTSSDAQWLICLERRPEASCRLLLLPFAGGGTVVYRSWVRSIAAHIEPWVALLPGRESRMAEEPLTRLRPLVDILAAELERNLDLDGRLALFGHSMGAVTAFELCRELRRRGRPAPSYLVLSGRRAPDIPPRRRPLHALPEPELIEELRRYDGTPEAILKDRDLMGLMLPLIRADLELVETYEYRPEPPLEIPFMVFGGDSDPDANLEELEGWRRQTSSSFELTVLPGGHFYFFKEHRALMEAVCRRL